MPSFQCRSRAALLRPWLLWILLWQYPWTLAATQEEAVKAGIIYHFTQFVDWPADTRKTDEFNLCIVGKDELHGALEAINGKPIGKLHIVLKRNLTLDEITACQMVFISASELPRLNSLLPLLRDMHALTVSDAPHFTDSEGMIGLIRDGKHLVFDINLDAVDKAGLHINAQLLKLAKHVKGNQR